MDLTVKNIFLILQVCAIASSVVLQGFSGHEISPSAAIFSAVSPIVEGSPHRVTQEGLPGPTAQPNNSPHFESTLEPSTSPNTPLNEQPHVEVPVSPPVAAAPINSSAKGLPPSPPVIQPPIPVAVPPIPQQDKRPDSPSNTPIVSVQIAPPPKEVTPNPPPVPEVAPSTSEVPPNPPSVPKVAPSTSQEPPNPPSVHEVAPYTSQVPPNPPSVPEVAPFISRVPPNPPSVPEVAPSTSQVPPNPPSVHEVAPSTSQVPPSAPKRPPLILPGPVSSPTLPAAPSQLPVPVVLPPSTLPRNSSPSPPTLPSNLTVPTTTPPSSLPINSPPSPPTLSVPPSALPVPVALPPSTLPISPTSPPTLPPPSTLPVPVVSAPNTLPRNSPPSPPTLAVPPSNFRVPVALPPTAVPRNLPPPYHTSVEPPNIPETHVSPVSSPPNRPTNIAPTHHSSGKAPPLHKAPRFYNHAPPPDSSFKSPPLKSHPQPSLPPLYPPPPPGPMSKPRHHAPSPPNPGSGMPPTEISPPTKSPSTQTIISPPRASPRIPKPIQALPPPPPNEDCLSITCNEPLTNTPPGTPCNCVMPMQVGLGLSVALYTFFPLVSELAFDIAAGVFMKSSQVRIMGANANDQDPEKTVVIVDLVPLGEKFDSFTASLTAQRLWNKKVVIKSPLFGDYEVLYVKYPGLPPSPPLPSSNFGINGGPYGRGNDGRTIKPLGVDLSSQRHNNKLNSGIIAIISLSTIVAVFLACVVAWVILFKRRDGPHSEPTPPTTLPSLTKSSGNGGSMVGSGPTSASLSFRSSIAYTGSAKTFSSSEMEKATNNFDESGVLGEGGFGRVYSGVLDDGTKVAVKVLKRDDQQGGREFLAEVEMLSCLHHRNLVRLLGICIEERNRCLVYELIPNGSVESHLHGVDKETAPLDWGARLKIALGAARGLAYLHEDSSPRVIHRDFKSSNILLEHDFTPKVSDFGLARTALDEENRHISTRVMGTFGYVAPEYAMTGHLLVKSDVYSYGVVLLELLTGRKPVDMSMPPGQENLVAWARPLLSTPEGLNLLIDPSLSPDVPFDSIAKVAAIALMCVQPEVSHRPFMGEVVQALKLVCNECEETRDLGSRSSHEDLASLEFDARVSPNSGPDQASYSSYDSPLDVESGLSVSGLGLGLGLGLYTMSSRSGPMRTSRRLQLWEKMKRFSSGSASEHGDLLRLLSRSR